MSRSIIVVKGASFLVEEAVKRFGIKEDFELLVKTVSDLEESTGTAWTMETIHGDEWIELLRRNDEGNNKLYVVTNTETGMRLNFAIPKEGSEMNNDKLNGILGKIPGIEKLVRGYRTKQFFKKLKNAETPMEAWELSKEYLEGDLVSGWKFGHKGVIVESATDYDHEKGELNVEFSITVKGEEKPMLASQLCFNDSNIKALFNAVVSFKAML